jgi:hypothetical protein
MLLDRIRHLRRWQWNQQRPPPTYDEILRVALALSRINAQLIERQFAISPDAAAAFMARLVAGGHFDAMGMDGWHCPQARQKRLRRSRAKRKLTEVPTKVVDISDQRASVADLGRRIEELEREGRTLRASVKRLQTAGKTVISQREEWKTRALTAEQLVEFERRHPTKVDERFDALRRLIAKELHPDFSTGGGLDKLLRAECFKKLWPEIERLVERK